MCVGLLRFANYKLPCFGWGRSEACRTSSKLLLRPKMLLPISSHSNQLIYGCGQTPFVKLDFPR